jgi:hypothetical protein
MAVNLFKPQRGICPSCGAKRALLFAEHLHERALVQRFHGPFCSADLSPLVLVGSMSVIISTGRKKNGPFM